MARRAIAKIARKLNAVEIVHRRLEPKHGVVILEILPTMNLVNHSPEIHRLCRIRRCWPLSGVSRVGVMTEHALLNRIAVVAMHTQAGVAGVAVGKRHHRAARRDGSTVHRKVQHYIVSSIPDAHLLHRAWQELDGPITLYPDGKRARGLRRDRVLELIRVRAIVVRGRLTAILGNVRRVVR